MAERGKIDGRRTIGGRKRGELVEKRSWIQSAARIRGARVDVRGSDRSSTRTTCAALIAERHHSSEPTLTTPGRDFKLSFDGIKNVGWKRQGKRNISFSSPCLSRERELSRDRLKSAIYFFPKEECKEERREKTRVKTR